MNRELVERTTHPEALAAFDGMGEDWAKLKIEIEGIEIADMQEGENIVVRRDCTFLDEEVIFGGDSEERVQTRLGDDYVEVNLEPAQPSPFNREKISSVSVRMRWLHSPSDAPETPITTQATEGGFTFAIGDRRFEYGRMGLRPL